jgi:hypothetical protein
MCVLPLLLAFLATHVKLDLKPLGEIRKLQPVGFEIIAKIVHRLLFTV